MKIVIDIPNYIYSYAIHYRYTKDDMFTAMEAIKNGKPFPKGHGRLIDADALEGQPMITPRGNGQYEDVTVYYQNDIDVATTIIEADKREKENGKICD